MTLRGFDWKFFLTISVALAGVILPFLIWKADFSSKALELRVTSLSSLEPASRIRNLEMFLNGNKLEAPYASTIKLVNTGSKPVMSQDFDTPVEIYLNEGARFAGAQLAATSPSGLPVELKVTDQAIVISKHLSNPGDSMTLNVVTSGTRPAFGVKARIAGISKIAMLDQTVPKINFAQRTEDVIRLICGATLFAISLLFLVVRLTMPETLVPRSVSHTVMAISYVSAVLLVGAALKNYDLSTGATIAAALGVGLVAWAASTYLMRVWDKKVSGTGNSDPA